MADRPRLAEQFSLFFSVFSGSVSTASLGLSRGAGKLSAPRRRGHCLGSLLAPRPRTGVGMTLPSHPSSESLDVGRWGGEPLSRCSTLPPHPHSASFSFLLLPPSFPFSSSPKGLSAPGWRRPGVPCALARGFQDPGALAGAGASGRPRAPGRVAAGPARAAPGGAGGADRGAADGRQVR